MKLFLTIIFILTAYISIKSQVPSADYQLIWEDNFEGLTLDKDKWGPRSTGKRRDAYNVIQNATVQNGYLALRTESRNDSILTSMISTQHKFETTYGYFEIRCLVQQKIGHWSAFWLQSNILGKFIGSPAKSGAEIDIYEFLPNKPKQIHQTVHWDGYGEHHKNKHKTVKKLRFNSNEFHTFGVEWTPTHYTFYIDGIPTFTVKEGISKINQYIIVSLEVGDWAGKINQDKFLDYLIVDYIKVYQK